MNLPQSPPKFKDLIAEIAPERIMQLASHLRTGTGHYLHWDKIRHRPPPEGLSHREWWLILKLARTNALQPIDLKDKEGRPFQFAVPERVLQELHKIDLSTGGLVSVPEPIVNPQTRDRYLVRSQMEEAITSSQIEGAATTRDFEFISISTILRKAPVQYGRSFLYTETDDNDLTYFLVAQTEVISQAIGELHRYIERKAAQLRQAEQDIQALALFNHRQVALIGHALSNPRQRYTIASHQHSHAVAYQTARTDLLDLSERGVLEMAKKGRPMIFVAPTDMAERLNSLNVHPGTDQ